MGGRNIRVHGIRLSFVTGSPSFLYSPLHKQGNTQQNGQKRRTPLLPVLSKANTYDFNAMAEKFPPHANPLLRHAPEE